MATGWAPVGEPALSYPIRLARLSPLSNVSTVLVIGGALYRRRIFVMATPSRLPPATGYFSFETPLATGYSLVKKPAGTSLFGASEETSRVWNLLGVDSIA